MNHNKHFKKKISKKVTACTGAMLLAMSMQMGALAETAGDNSKDTLNSEAIVNAAANTSTRDVMAKYSSASNANKVYSVDIIWGDMEYIYTENPANIWNPETHVYSTALKGTWATTSTAGDLVKVSNNSNANVGVAFNYEAAADNGVAGAIVIPAEKNATQTTLAKAVYADTTAAGTPSAEAKLTLTGRPGNTMADGTAVGTVTVTLTEDAQDTSVTMK